MALKLTSTFKNIIDEVNKKANVNVDTDTFKGQYLEVSKGTNSTKYFTDSIEATSGFPQTTTEYKFSELATKTDLTALATKADILNIIPLTIEEYISDLTSLSGTFDSDDLKSINNRYKNTAINLQLKYTIPVINVSVVEEMLFRFELNNNGTYYFNNFWDSTSLKKYSFVVNSSSGDWSIELTSINMNNYVSTTIFDKYKDELHFDINNDPVEVVFTFAETSESTQVTLNNLTEDQKFKIDWGDGTGETTETTHTSYEQGKSYTCKIWGLTKIPEEMCINNVNVTNIKISKHILSIEAGAFSGCSNIESIKIPDNVNEIGFSAFYGCSSLKEITLPFVGATKDGTENTHFGYIFGVSNNSDVPSSLKKVTITGGSSIGDEAFEHCDDLSSVVIPDSVTKIGDYAFNNCVGLTSVVIPDRVTSIGNYAFQNCSNLTSVVIGDSVTSIGECAFNGCDSLTSVVIPDSVEIIYNGAFLGCINLTSVVMPDRVTSIGNYAFGSCSNLTSVEIPNRVTSIGNNAFNSCSKLTKVIFNNPTPITYDLTWFTTVPTIVVPKDAIESYKNNWTEFTGSIVANITTYVDESNILIDDKVVMTKDRFSYSNGILTITLG